MEDHRGHFGERVREVGDDIGVASDAVVGVDAHDRAVLLGLLHHGIHVTGYGELVADLDALECVAGQRHAPGDLTQAVLLVPGVEVDEGYDASGVVLGRLEVEVVILLELLHVLAAAPHGDDGVDSRLVHLLYHGLGGERDTSSPGAEMYVCVDYNWIFSTCQYIT